MEYWSDLYLELAEKVNENMPKIQWIDLWHEQVNYLSSEHPFPTPAVFISFNMLEAEDQGLLAQNCNTQIDFRLYYETFDDTYTGSYNQESALDFLRELTNIHKLFHGTSGEHYNEMRRIAMVDEASGNAGNLYRISFACNVYDDSAIKQYNETEVNEIAIKRDSISRNESENKHYEIEI
jgi:hypothetical protein